MGLFGYWENSLSDNQSLVANVLIDSEQHQILNSTDIMGNRVWQKKLDTKIKKAIIIDLDSDGTPEIIAGTERVSYSDWGIHPGYFYVWDIQGNLITKENLWKESIYPAKESQATIVDFQIVDLDDDSTKAIVTLIRGLEWYPSRLAIFHYKNKKFTEINTYWHPGFLSLLFIKDLNHDGKKEIFCGCTNNDLKRLPEYKTDRNLNSFFMIKYDSVFGQSPPYLGNAVHGGQSWYYYITGPVNPDCSVGALGIMGPEQNQLLVKLASSCFYTLDYQGNIINSFSGDSCRWQTELHLYSEEPDTIGKPLN